jgi:hypothetical protein
VTLDSLLHAGTKRRFRPNSPYFFCSACPIVYHTPATTFTVVDLLVPVWQKNPHDPTIPVCYCFGHTPASIADEIRLTGASTVHASIAAKVRAGECACDTRNPQGSCCLGNVAAIVKGLER